MSREEKVKYVPRFRTSQVEQFLGVSKEGLKFRDPYQAANISFYGFLFMFCLLG